MQVIARVHVGAKLLRVVRIAHRGIEIHDRIENSAVADEIVFSLAHHFARIGRIARSDVGSQRAANHFEAAGWARSTIWRRAAIRSAEVSPVLTRVWLPMSLMPSRTMSHFAPDWIRTS